VSTGIQQQCDFSNAAIDELQHVIDDFFVTWVDLVGRDGITNYIHMMGAGHFHFFFCRWRNLYCYANQGWEHYNSAIKSFHHRRTQQNGFVSYNTDKKPIGLWLLHCLMWKTGQGELFFENLTNMPEHGENDVNEDTNNDDNDKFL